MQYNEKLSFLFVLIAAVSVFFVDLYFFFIIAGIALIFMSFEVTHNLNANPGQNPVFMDYVLILLPLILSAFVPKQFSISLIFIAVFFAVKLIIIAMHSDRSANQTGDTENILSSISPQIDNLKDVVNKTGDKIQQSIHMVSDNLNSNIMNTANTGLENMDKNMNQITEKLVNLADQSNKNMDTIINSIQIMHEDSLRKIEAHEGDYLLSAADMNKEMLKKQLAIMEHDRERVEAFYNDLRNNQISYQAELMARFQTVEDNINNFANKLEATIIEEKETILKRFDLMDDNKLKNLKRQYWDQYGENTPPRTIDFLADGSFWFEIYNDTKQKYDINFGDLIIIKYGKAVEELMRKMVSRLPSHEIDNRDVSRLMMWDLRNCLHLDRKVHGYIGGVIHLRNKAAHPDEIHDADIKEIREILFEKRLIALLLDKKAVKTDLLLKN